MGPATQEISVDLSRGDFVPKHVAIAVYVGWGGRLTVTAPGGQVIRLEELRKGMFLPMSIAKVHKRGTSCRRLVLLFS